MARSTKRHSYVARCKPTLACRSERGSGKIAACSAQRFAAGPRGRRRPPLSSELLAWSGFKYNLGRRYDFMWSSISALAPFSNCGRCKQHNTGGTVCPIELISSSHFFKYTTHDILSIRLTSSSNTPPPPSSPALLCHLPIISHEYISFSIGMCTARRSLRVRMSFL